MLQDCLEHRSFHDFLYRYISFITLFLSCEQLSDCSLQIGNHDDHFSRNTSILLPFQVTTSMF